MASNGQSTPDLGVQQRAPESIPSAADVVAALFNDMTYGRRRKLKPIGTPLPKRFKPPRRARRGWVPSAAI